MKKTEKFDWGHVHYRMENEGFDYCFRSYSHFDEIKDEKFHELRELYIKTAEQLEEYVNCKFQEIEEGE